MTRLLVLALAAAGCAGNLSDGGDDDPPHPDAQPRAPATRQHRRRNERLNLP